MDPEMKVTSATKAPEIEVTSATADLEFEVASVIEGPETERYWKYDSTSSSDSIFRDPDHKRYGRESYFVPELVSIGPYHRGREKLQPMEEKKVWCMKNLLMMRPGDEKKGEDKYLFYNRGASNMDYPVPVEPFMKFERRARGFYKEKFDQISPVEFVQMLLLDSCFLIRIFLSFFGVIPESMGSLEVDIKGVRSDFLLLENQIPLFFLNVLYYWLFPNAKGSIDLSDILFWFIECDLPWYISPNCLFFESDHLLDFYWKSSVPETDELIKIMKNHERQQTPSWMHIPDTPLPKLIANATELHQKAGIEFQSDEDYRGVQVEFGNHDHDQGTRVKFSKGIMRMHCLKIDSTLPTLLVNLTAYENSMKTSLRIISTYIKLLDDLIDSEKDVELLQNFGVIYNTLSTHADVATFFKVIGNLNINRYDNPFANLFENVNKYHKSSWKRSLASLQNNYFYSLWAGTSVVAGVILLILTVLGTFYTIYAYYKPRH